MEPPGGGTAAWLQQYGPWAVVVLCLGAIAVLWRTIAARDEKSEKREETHATQLERIGKECRDEMSVLLDRLVASSNSQVEKFAALAEQSARVVEALTRRVRKPVRGGEVDE